MRILIGVLSCNLHRPIHSVHRNTWVRHVPSSAAMAVDVRFFVGNGISQPLEVDEVFVPVGDSKPEHNQKTWLMYKYALEFEYDYFFKIDNDTFVAPDRLLLSGFARHDHVGMLQDMVVYEQKVAPFLCLHGGAGYWASRRFVCAVVKRGMKEFCRYPWEDVGAGYIAFQEGIVPAGDRRYRSEVKIGSDAGQPEPDNDIITTHHLRKAQDFYRVYSRLYHEVPEGLIQQFDQDFAGMPDYLLLTIIRNESAPPENRAALSYLLELRGSSLSSHPEVVCWRKQFIRV